MCQNALIKWERMWRNVRAKIQDVAKLAGVSVSTVSRYLNGGFKVSEKAKVRIKESIRTLDYSPSVLAQGLVSKKSKLIGIIIPDITSSFFSTILCNIEEEASLQKFNLAICDIAESLEKEYNYLRYLAQLSVGGIIVMHEKTNMHVLKLIQSMAIPMVLCSCAVKDLALPSILINDEQAAFDETCYFIALNHKRIAYLGGDMRDVTSGQQRFAGYRRAMCEANLPVEERYMKFGDYKFDSGYRLMAELLQCDPLPTAVFASSDDMAVGALNCILDHGMKVPDDFSLAGFDGSALTDLVRPKLTTLEQPIREMGKMAVETLINRINGSTGVSQIVLQHRLKIQDSCRKL